MAPTLRNPKKEGIRTQENIERNAGSIEQLFQSIVEESLDNDLASVACPANTKTVAPAIDVPSETVSTSAVPEEETVPSLPSWLELLKLFGSKVKRSLWPEHPQRTFLKYAAASVALILIGLIPWPHHVKCSVVCEPVVRRYVAAPFDGRLLESNVVVSQQVRAGQVLATMDGGELRSQLAGVRAKLAQSEQRQFAALSTGDHSKAEFERLEVEFLQREIELLERRQSNLEIRSPIDGVVVSGDLERAQGAPLAVGENLFEIASLENLIAEVAIPESAIAFVENHMPVTVILDSAPDRTFESTVDRIHLRNEIRENVSVFVAETELFNDDSILRPGMNGDATIHTGYRALAWVMFHRPCNAVRHWIGW